MKILVIILSLLSLGIHAQDTKQYISASDNKVYSLKSIGVRDFVVDIESSKLTKQMNEQMIFGNVKRLTFRVYWTANPERIAIDVLGLPEGFKEVKEELKLNILSIMDNLLPLTIEKRFSGYSISPGKDSKEFVAKDQSGIAMIPSYTLKFDANDILSEVVGNKPIGSFNMTSKYEKLKFANGKWVLTEQVTTSEENGQTMTSTKELDYGEMNGMGVLEEVTITAVQKWEKADIKPLKMEETLEFKNYKINSGEGLKYFLGESLKK